MSLQEAGGLAEGMAVVGWDEGRDRMWGWTGRSAL